MARPVSGCPVRGRESDRRVAVLRPAELDCEPGPDGPDATRDEPEEDPPELALEPLRGVADPDLLLDDDEGVRDPGD